jgi:flagellar protein FlbD
MIELTKLNGTKLVINSDLIEYIEALPDSLIKMTTGMKIMVKENVPEIIAAVIEFRRSIRREENRHARKIPNKAVDILVDEVDSPSDTSAD